MENSQASAHAKGKSDTECPTPQKRQRPEGCTGSPVQVMDFSDLLALEEASTPSPSQIFVCGSSDNSSVAENHNVSHMSCGDNEKGKSPRGSHTEIWHPSYSHILLSSDDFSGIDSMERHDQSTSDVRQMEGEDCDAGFDSDIQPVTDHALDFFEVTDADLRGIGENELLDFLESFEGLQQVGMGQGAVTEIAEPVESEKNDRYSITVKEGRMVKKFNVRESIYVVKLHPRYNNEGWKENLHVLIDCLQEVVDIATADLNSQDLVRAYINQAGLQTPLILDLCTVEEFTVDKVLAIVEKLLQSNETLRFDQSFEIHIAAIKLIRGGGRLKAVDLMSDLVGKRSVVTITNDDFLCAARATVVGRAFLENSDKNYRYIRRSDRPKQRELAVDLCVKAGVNMHMTASIADIRAFETVIGRQIVVISASTLNKVIYSGSPSIKCDRQIFLYYHHNHYDLINNPSGFYGHGYYCYQCLVPYYHLDGHKCQSRCEICYRNNCPAGDKVFCPKCNRTCNNADCFRLHEKVKQDIVRNSELASTCKRLWKCLKCGVIITRSRRNPEKHLCGEKFCFTCQFHYTGKHNCFIKPKKPSKPVSRFIFFDFETIQDTGLHMPNYCVAHRCCIQCIDSIQIDEPCAFCRQRQFIFQGVDTCNTFCTWLFSPENSGSVALAHNMKGFDGVFILNFLIQNGVKPSVIFSGSKIMSIEVASRNIRIIDSLNHIPMPLANLPKAFQLGSHCKGFFPYLFNTLENANHDGDLPDAEFYDPDSMFQETRERFVEWYAEQKSNGVKFNLQEEMKKYAISDVDILRKACLTFRKLIMGISLITSGDGESLSVDPFNCLTLASLCFDIFRHMFLKPYTVGKVQPEHHTQDQYSRTSIIWLEWVMKQSNEAGHRIRIEHAVNSREKRIGPYRADGFDPVNNTVYFFDGDYWHGNPDVYRAETLNEKVNATMGFLYQKTLDRKVFFESRGYNYISIWENDFVTLIKENSELKAFSDVQDVPDRLDPRKAFYGGRCNASRLFYSVQEGERILYYDVCSLYPSICKYGVFPKGFPEVITTGFRPLENYVGFVLAKVLPPRRLYHPVLPYRTGGKLMFPLCRTCCENKIYLCNHSEDERCLTGTWVTMELMKAIEKGYRVKKVYEVWHFRETMQYDGKDENTGLFTKYINTFLKIKQEASGWPDWVRTDVDKMEYVQKYRMNEGIQLDPCKIEKNPGLRSVSKLCLNSLWGKFSQRSQLRKNSYVTDLEEFYGLLFSDTKQVLDIHILSEDVLLVDWVERKNFVKAPSSSNVFIGAFTTCQARLKLYDVLDIVGDRALYYDTDSCVFVSRPGVTDPAIGDYLGQLTDELSGDYIETFVAAGPKNYAYKTHTGNEVCKVRGFTLNYRNSMVLNFNTVRDMVLTSAMITCTCTPAKANCLTCIPYVSVRNDRKICRDRIKMTVFNRKEIKNYRLCYDKRCICEDLDTLPYGY